MGNVKAEQRQEAKGGDTNKRMKRPFMRRQELGALDLEVGTPVFIGIGVRLIDGNQKTSYFDAGHRDLQLALQRTVHPGQNQVAKM